MSMRKGPKRKLGNSPGQATKKSKVSVTSGNVEIGGSHGSRLAYILKSRGLIQEVQEQKEKDAKPGPSKPIRASHSSQKASRLPSRGKLSQSKSRRSDQVQQPELSEDEDEKEDVGIEEDGVSAYHSLVGSLKTSGADPLVKGKLGPKSRLPKRTGFKGAEREEKTSPKAVPGVTGPHPVTGNGSSGKKGEGADFSAAPQNGHSEEPLGQPQNSPEDGGAEPALRTGTAAGLDSGEVSGGAEGRFLQHFGRAMNESEASALALTPTSWTEVPGDACFSAWEGGRWMTSGQALPPVRKLKT